MFDVARPYRPPHDAAARRKRARRFWGTMAGALRKTSDLMSERTQARANGALLPFRTPHIARLDLRGM